MKSARIKLRGVVQGVGFRPFIYRLAKEHNLTGWVRNTSGSVNIEVEGKETGLRAFLNDLKTEAPPAARIERVEATFHPCKGYNTFKIRESRSEPDKYQLVSTDIATCDDCKKEIFAPSDRRYHYPFTNCTNCGPRFTIIEDIPYDRPKTTMREFKMCPSCQQEYDNPEARRFHAQPNACPVCGPHLELVNGNGKPVVCDDVIKKAAEMLKAGKILALRGLGGFQLACDATNEVVVNLLRKRKHRPSKPFAVMLGSLEEIKGYCIVSPEEARLLGSPEAPIVLLKWRAGSQVKIPLKRLPKNCHSGLRAGIRRGEDMVEINSNHPSPVLDSSFRWNDSLINDKHSWTTLNMIKICAAVAPHNKYLGVMLPHTPLHHLLLREAGLPLIMTSGNLSEEPIAKDNDEVLRRLKGIADYFILHNRDIYARYDDSVCLVEDGKPQIVRRARGYAPYPIFLPYKSRQVLACGAEEKNTFCLTKDDHAFVSQHIGDMENTETLEHYENTVELYKKLFRVKPEIIAYDMHPEYLATKYALNIGEEQKLKLVPVQHHHAHIVSCLAENKVKGRVIGVAFDGTGYGTDGAIWGGEFLLADRRGFTRLGHLEYVPLPGGAAAIKKPYRMALSYIYTLLGENYPLDGLPLEKHSVEYEIIKQQLKRKINSPLTSSAGRLFDVVAALAGVRDEIDYEAQAAIELEMITTDDIKDSTAYPFSIVRQNGVRIIKLAELTRAVIEDIKEGMPSAVISLRFHNTMAQIILQTSRLLAKDTGIKQVALSGGVFQNRLLQRLTLAALKKAGFEVFTHHLVPCNDGGISLGQAVVAMYAK